MKRNKLFVVILIAVVVFGDAECRKNSRNRGSRPASRTTPRPRHTYHDHTVNPNKIGWSIPEANKKPSSNVGPKPSAPLPEQNFATKVNAPSQQSGHPGYNNQNAHQLAPSSGGQGYNPSVGQQYHQHGNPPYNSGVGSPHQYPGASGQSYNPSVGQSYHQPGGSAYNPSVGNPYQQPIGHTYNPAVGQPYQQPIGQPYNPPVGQTVILAPAQAPASSNRGLGQIAKEAVVFAGINAGVNAAVNRLLPGGSRGGGGSNTQITYNNYYNNQTDAQGNPVTSASPAAESSGAAKPAEGASPAAGSQGAVPPVPSNPENANAEPAKITNDSPTAAVIPHLNADPLNSGSAVANNPMAPPAQTNLVSNEELLKLSQDLFEADTNNAFKHIAVKLQGQKTDDSVTDSATEPLLNVQPEALKIPTVDALRSLYDKYELDSKVAEKVTAEKRDAETSLIGSFLATDVMAKAMKFIADKGLIPNDEYEFKDALKRIWFSQYARENNVISSSGFESVFLAEKVNSEIVGLHNWIYFNEQESSGRANYLGYIREAKLGSNAAIVKLRSTLNDIVRPVTTIFVGTSPELEMALYTVCFFVRPNGACPVSFGGTPFTIYTSKITYYGKEIMFAAYPEI